MKEAGFLNINKPSGCTSYDVVLMLRRSLEIEKIGHGGTLDPITTGVLVIGINDATRLFEYLPKDKTYLAEITFGISTDTDDMTGNILNRSDYIPMLDEILEKIKFFLGKVKQKPPIFSAVKLNGKRAYNLARRKEISLDDFKEKEVEIYSIEFLSYDSGTYSSKALRLKIHCSGGTYIRSFARDLGTVLNTPATLSGLVRIKVGDCFTYEQSVVLDSVNRLALKNYLISPLSALNLKKVYLKPEQVVDISCGREIKSDDFCYGAYNPMVKSVLLDNNNKIIAIGKATYNSTIKPEKVFTAT